ncbi:MAG: hypothetical protein NT068_02905 [Candidatus Nomurabacteria bacterium]|nr:hypothetical protein [Candidatus Nomurabacteria bacterium]
MNKLLKMSSVFAIVAGIILVVGGIWGISFTHENISREKIVTAEDSAMPGVPLSGPRSLRAQADIIREHTLKTTGGKTYAEMPRQIPQLDASGKPALDEKGEQIMVNNAPRDLWVTATTLTTALNLAIFTYVFSSLVILLGLISLWTGFLFHSLRKHY